MSQPGVGLIGLCNKGTLGTTNTNAIGMGLKTGTSVKWSTYKDNETAYKQKLINKCNVGIESESFQSSMKMLKILLYFGANGFDTQIISSKQSAGASNGLVYQFADPNILGLDFEGEISAAKRTMKVILESAFDNDTAQSLIDSADNNSPVDMGFTNPEDIDFDLQRAPYFLSVQSPNLTNLAEKYDIVERKFTYKTESSKNEYNQSNIDFIDYVFELTVRATSITDVLTFMNKARGIEVVMREKNTGSYYDGYNFLENVLTKTDEYIIDDKQHVFKMIYGAKVPFYHHTVALGTGNGGAADDEDGSTGGTLVIG